MKLFCMCDGCLNFISTELPVIPGAAFLCKEHTPLGTDEVRFQEYQFDPDIASGSSPQIDSGDEAAPIIEDENSKLDEDLYEVDEDDLDKLGDDFTDA